MIPRDRCIKGRLAKLRESSPWITIAIPSYNRAHLLRRAVKSVIGQTEGDWELWIVDDASCDDAWTIAEEASHSDTRIHATRHPRNLGLAQNFSYAAQCGTAPYLLLLAADDFLDSQFLQYVRTVVEHDPHLALICARRIHQRSNGRQRYFDTPLIGRYSPGKVVARALRNGNLFGLYSSVVVQRDALIEIGGIRQDNTWAGDFEAFTKISARHPVYFEPRALAYQNVDRSTQTFAMVRDATLISFEFATLERLLEDPAVKDSIGNKDVLRAWNRIIAIQWALRLYSLATSPFNSKVTPPPLRPKCAPQFSNWTVFFTLVRLLWCRARLTY